MATYGQGAGTNTLFNNQLLIGRPGLDGPEIRRGEPLGRAVGGAGLLTQVEAKAPRPGGRVAANVLGRVLTCSMQQTRIPPFPVEDDGSDLLPRDGAGDRLGVHQCKREDRASRGQGAPAKMTWPGRCSASAACKQTTSARRSRSPRTYWNLTKR